MQDDTNTVADQPTDRRIDAVNSPRRISTFFQLLVRARAAFNMAVELSMAITRSANGPNAVANGAESSAARSSMRTPEAA